jgi:hypothetical protein
MPESQEQDNQIPTDGTEQALQAKEHAFLLDGLMGHAPKWTDRRFPLIW